MADERQQRSSLIWQNDLCITENNSEGRATQNSSKKSANDEEQMTRFCGYAKNIVTTITETPQIIRLNRQLALLTRASRFEDALYLFDEIHSHHHHLKPDPYTLSTTLTASANLPSVTFGNELHGYAVKTGLKEDPHVANTLLLLYAKAPDFGSLKLVFEEIGDPDVYSYTTLLSACVRMGDVEYAFKVFDAMPHRDVPVWNAMITGCVENGHEEVAFGMFRDMCRLGVAHDNYSFASVLSGCYSEWVDFGNQVHSLVVKTGFMARTSVANALITMYVKNENVAGAHLVFEEVGDLVRNQITYNVMIEGLANVGRVGKIWILFRDMLRSCLKPTGLTFVSLLSSCLSLTIGYQVHSQAIKMGFEACTFVSNAAITMYSNCQDFHAAYVVFNRLEEKDLVSWNSIMSSYAKGNFGNSTILAYLEMRKVMIEPDEFTFGSLLASSVCATVVEMIHAVMFRFGLIANIQVINALVTAYSKHGKMKDAHLTFCHATSKNLITWNTIISRFVFNGLPRQGLKLFSELLVSELRPNECSLNLALSICSSISSLRLGKQIHSYILTSGFASIQLGNALITLYAKCGHLDWSLRIFSHMTDRDIVSWNALISAYAQHGQGLEAVQCFEAMQNSSGVKPDKVTFTTVLSACSHTGLVDEGTRIFNSMLNCHGVKPEVGHFSTIVDLLGRAGYFDEVEKIMKNEHFAAHPDIWWSLLSACAAHGNLQLGTLVAGFLLEMEKDNPSVFVLLSNTYAAAGQWAEAANVRHSIDNIGVKKEPGFSWFSA